jgi:oxygen-independent coproporphyrinogen-3 oxidase
MVFDRKLANFIIKDIAFYSGYSFYPPDLTWVDRLPFHSIKTSWQQKAAYVEKNASARDPIGIYVHVPFCLSKCYFCNLMSFSATTDVIQDLYVESFKKEIKLLDFSKKMPIETIYIGGGTPTILSLKNLKNLFVTLWKNFDLKNCRQILMEASPQTTNFEKMKLMKNYGVTKVTFGVQTLNKTTLHINNRVQQDSALPIAYAAARKAGIPYINLDIMFGLPGESISAFLDTVRKVISFAPDTIHLNPFRPQFKTHFVSSGNRLDILDSLKRQRMYYWGTKLIEQKLKNVMEIDNHPKENMQLHHCKSTNCSVLGLGFGAISHVFNKFYYFNSIDPQKECTVKTFKNHFDSYVSSLNKNKFPPIFGIQLNPDLEMRKFVIINFMKGGVLNALAFKNLFLRDVDVVFKSEFDWLFKRKSIKKNDDSYIFLSQSKKERAILSTIFFDSRTLTFFKKRFQNKQLNSIPDEFLLFLYD